MVNVSASDVIDGMATSINGSCNEATASASGEALTDIVQLSLACVGRKRIFRCERNFLIAKADDVMPAKNKEPTHHSDQNDPQWRRRRRLFDI